MKIEKFSVFKITKDRDLIEEILGDDDAPFPGARFLVVENDGETIDAILEDFNGKFDLENSPAYFSVEDFEKVAKFEGKISKGEVGL